MTRKIETYPDTLVTQGTEGEVIVSRGDTVVSTVYRDADVIITTETETILTSVPSDDN